MTVMQMSVILTMTSLLVLLIFMTESAGTLDTAPPQRPPVEIVPQLTMDGLIPLEYYYVDDSNKGKGTHYKYSYEDISGMIAQAKRFVSDVLAAPLPPPPQSPPQTSTWLTQLTDVWLVHALQASGVAGTKAVVFGSTEPWYECMLLAMGALSVTTIEYNQLTYAHPKLSTVLVGDPLPRQFDRALSLSSFDHDGLGRYGDPINPIGDMVAMETVKQVLTDDGLLFLTVPIGPDVVVWNLHRRYGNHRLPSLLRGWVQVTCVGWSERLATANTSYTAVYEPVFVLAPSHNIGAD